MNCVVFKNFERANCFNPMRRSLNVVQLYLVIFCFQYSRSCVMMLKINKWHWQTVYTCIIKSIQLSFVFPSFLCLHFKYVLHQGMNNVCSVCSLVNLLDVTKMYFHFSELFLLYVEYKVLIFLLTLSLSCFLCMYSLKWFRFHLYEQGQKIFVSNLFINMLSLLIFRFDVFFYTLLPMSLFEKYCFCWRLFSSIAFNSYHMDH